ncbi:hypothetical protein NDU88_002972 [Pleurodeles waltl]|uniref:Uncharacterized protein n=1 Tax=Pleurodeles waltl TaxID=8319 RepID=A0AAV7T4S1_PLEWA|nr:hypothetical protein NDU88_002972 [Pleurodeles waltl]
MGRSRYTYVAIYIQTLDFTGAASCLLNFQTGLSLNGIRAHAEPGEEACGRQRYSQLGCVSLSWPLSRRLSQMADARDLRRITSLLRVRRIELAGQTVGEYSFVTVFKSH